MTLLLARALLLVRRLLLLRRRLNVLRLCVDMWVVLRLPAELTSALPRASVHVCSVYMQSSQTPSFRWRRRQRNPRWHWRCWRWHWGGNGHPGRRMRLHVEFHPTPVRFQNNCY